MAVEDSATAALVEVVRGKLDSVRTRSLSDSYLGNTSLVSKKSLIDEHGEYIVVTEEIPVVAKRRRRKPEDQLTFDVVTEALVCNLVHRHLSGPSQSWQPDHSCLPHENRLGWSRIPLSHQRLGKGADRYRSRAMSRMLRPIVKAMADLDLVDLREGRSGKIRREQSRIRASDWFRDMMRQQCVSFDDLMRDTANEEVIILKDRKLAVWPRTLYAESIDYRDTPDTMRMREEVRSINGWLQGADICFVTDGEGDVHDRGLRRVFNNRSFESGGRLLGGFWMQTSMGRDNWELLRNVRIEGDAVAVVGYSSMFLRLLYCEAGVQAPSGDLYAGIKELTDGEHPYREGVQRLLSMLMFRDELPRQASKELRLADVLPKGVKVKTMVAAICNLHSAVAHLFGTKIGHRLFKRESDILVRVLHRCRDLGIVALPVHDAIIVKEGMSVDARRVMLECYEAATGFIGEVGAPTTDLDTMHNYEDTVDGETGASSGDAEEDWK